MKLWKDRDDLTPVRWFFCEPGAKVFERLCSFRSLKTWSRDSDRTGMVGEVQQFRPYDKGANPLIYEGVNHCGTDLAMAGGGVSGLDKEIVTDSVGWSSCCAGDGPENLPKETCSLYPLGNLERLVPVLGLMRIPYLSWTSPFHLAAYSPWSSPFTAPVMTGTQIVGECLWVFLSEITTYAENAFFFIQLQIGIALRGTGPAKPPNCPSDGCGPPQIFINFGATSKADGSYASSAQEYSGLVQIVDMQQTPFLAGFVTTQSSAPLLPPLTLITMEQLA